MPIITAENLGKKYLIGHQSERESYTALRDVIAQSAKQWVSKTRQLLRGEQLLEGDTREEFWALQDLNFEIEAGDRVGIIGRNGAGKSTLLKILSRITEPTTGRVVINGRVASLLEVGTGFHPELSGRENIYLNGAILGMSRAEIRRKFDEIVAFAGVEKFIDTPVKRYSSGMYVRLAFSVAAHLEPEILVVDEVLAVGDAEFQKKCLGKMEDVSKNEGRTVLFVSHNMGAIEKLCEKGLLLEKGNLIFNSNNMNALINQYLTNKKEAFGETDWVNDGSRFQDCELIPLNFNIHYSDRTIPSEAPWKNDKSFVVEATLDVRYCDDTMNVGIAVYDTNGEVLLWSFTTDDPKSPRLKTGINKLSVAIPGRLLNEGEYEVELLASFHMRKFIIKPGEGPVVFLSIRGGLSDSFYWQSARPGKLAPVWNWEIN